jgi:hypothetical protein
MHKRIFILLVFIPLISAVSAFGSPIAKENAEDEIVVQLSKVTNGIKDELEDRYLRQIFAEVLTIKGGKIGEIISRFQSNTSYWVWTIGESKLPENINGITKLNAEGAATVLDYNKFQNASRLSVAGTILHEMVHAYLTLYFFRDGLNAKKEYPAILNAWMTSKKPDYNKIQHDEIVRSFIGDIAAALDEYSVMAGLNNADKDVYTDLAWGGLDFQDNIELTAEMKTRIQNRLVAEQLNQPLGSEMPVEFK